MKPSSPKKILIVVESIDVDDSSGSKANVALIHNLQQSGFELLVLHYTRKDIQLASTKCIAIREEKFNANYFLSRIQRKIQHWFGVNLAKHLEPKFGFSFTFFNDVQSIKDALEEQKGFNPDLVLTLSKGASFRPHYAVLNYPDFHHKWMAYIHDPYPFHYYPEPYNWSEPGYEQKIRFFEQVSKTCRWAVFPSLFLAEWMGKYYSNFLENVLIIPHQNITDLSKVEFPDYFDTAKMNFLHAGTLLPERNPLPLVGAFEQFIAKHPNAKKDVQLILIGNISDKFQSLRGEQKKIIPQVISAEYLPFNVVKNMQYLASVNIILESVSETSPFLPGKFPHCVAANKPILHLGPEKSEVRRLMGTDHEYFAEADDVEKISVLLEKLYIKWKENPESLRLNREDLQFYLSAEYLKEQINNLI